MSVRARQARGFTLIELLVVIAIIGLLIAILMPSLSDARRSAQSLKSQTNLREHARLGAAYAQEGSTAALGGNAQANWWGTSSEVLHPPHETRGHLWMGAGDHDWGGAEGEHSEFNTNASSNARGAMGRPFNRLLWGNGYSGKENADLFKIPGEDGMVTGVYSAPPPAPIFAQSVFRATGNSYMGDYYWYKHHFGDANLPEYRRWGAYKRPVTHFPDSSKSLLFWESRFIQAMANTEEIGAAGLSNGLGSQPRNVMGSYGRIGRFNVVFADGHAANVRLTKKGDMYRPNDFMQVNPQWWRLHWRGVDGWRYDNFQHKMVMQDWLSPWTNPNRRIDFTP